MKNSLRAALAAQDLNQVMSATDPLAYARGSSKPNARMSRARLIQVAYRILGEASCFLPENTLRGFIPGGPFSSPKIERTVRLFGALRRWVELEQGRGMDTRPAYEEDYNSPRWAGMHSPVTAAFGGGGLNASSSYYWNLRAALIRSGYNADKLFRATGKVLLWCYGGLPGYCNQNLDSALYALSRNSQPRRAVLLIRLERKFGRDFRSLSAIKKAGWFLMAVKRHKKSGNLI